MEIKQQQKASCHQLTKFLCRYTKLLASIIAVPMYENRE